MNGDSRSGYVVETDVMDGTDCNRGLVTVTAWAGVPLLALTAYLAVLIVRSGDLYRPELLIALIIACVATVLLAWNQLCVFLALLATASSRTDALSRVLIRFIRRFGTQQARAVIARHALALSVSTTAISAIGMPVFAAPLTPSTPSLTSTSSATHVLPFSSIDEGDSTIPDDLTWPALTAQSTSTAQSGGPSAQLPSPSHQMPHGTQPEGNAMAPSHSGPSTQTEHSAPSAKNTPPQVSHPAGSSASQSTDSSKQPASPSHAYSTDSSRKPASPVSSNGLGSAGQAASSVHSHGVGAAGHDASPAPTRNTASSNTGSATHYEIRPGDCLWTIAETSVPASASDATIARHVERLIHANAEVIGDDPDLIHPGTVITIPPKENS